MYSFFTSERNEMKETRVEREPAGKSACWDLECISTSPSSSEALLLRTTSNSGLPAKKGAFFWQRDRRRKRNKEEKVELKEKYSLKLN